MAGGRFWGRRYRLVPITDEPEAQVARLRGITSTKSPSSSLPYPAGRSSRPLNANRRHKPW
jgi:hypothetical protein